uniref:Uncharacterized protein n=1 Tax=Oncorhynchus tshawytscha TaxID=74940 RepID=A0AAZ3QX71_ONCTS
MGMLVFGKDKGVFRIKINGIELSTSKILQENLLRSAFHQTLGEKLILQQDNNLKQKAKYRLELLSKKSVNIPEWPSYSFDLILLKNLWQDLKN